MTDDNSETIDWIGVNPLTGHVQLRVFDDRDWSDYQSHMEWLLHKLNVYIRYIISGQIKEDSAYNNRPITFVIHFNGRPPRAARMTVVRMRDHLKRQEIALSVTEGSDASEEVDIDSWSEQPG